MSDTIVYVDDSSIHGKGLFAKTLIPSGTVIGVIQGSQIFAFCSGPPLPRTVILIQIVAEILMAHLSVQTVSHIWMQLNSQR